MVAALATCLNLVPSYINSTNSFASQYNVFVAEVTALFIQIAFAPVEFTLSVGTAAVFAALNNTEMRAPATSLKFSHATTLAAVAATVDEVPYQLLPQFSTVLAAT